MTQYQKSSSTVFTSSRITYIIYHRIMIDTITLYRLYQDLEYFTYYINRKLFSMLNFVQILFYLCGHIKICSSPEHIR